MGYYVPKLLGENNRDSMTIGIEMGVQNAALAILVGGVFLSNQELVKPDRNGPRDRWYVREHGQQG